MACSYRRELPCWERLNLPGSGLSVFKLKFSAFFRQGTDRLKVQGHSSSKWGNWHLNSICDFMAMAQRGGE